MVRFGHVALLAALGCSPVKDYSNVPDAPPDMRPPEIASSAPENEAMKVSVLTPISVFFDESLDPASVDATTVKLSYRKSRQPLYPFGEIIPPYGPGQADITYVKGTVSYDEAGHKVSFVPAAPLPYGTELTLSLDVKDLAGLATAASVKFTTYVNGNTKQFGFNSATGAPNSWTGLPTDMNGRQTKYVPGGGPGADQIWFTPDDPRFDHYGFAFSPDGRILDEGYWNPGDDGQFDTADDTRAVCMRHSYNAQNAITESAFGTSVGTDAMWCTNDDVIAHLVTFKYVDDKIAEVIWFNSAGTDGMWRTPDDRCVTYWLFSDDDRGNRVREVRKECGADGVRNTADDAFSQYWEHEYDADGNVVSSTWRYNAGSDGQWLNDDDSIGEVTRYTRTADGLVTEMFRSYAPGPDMMWGTADDTSGNRTVYTYNAQKLAEDITSYSNSGSDAMWGTDDDAISLYSKLTYDAYGNRTRQKDYVAGKDGMWKNEDDRVVRDYQFDLDR